jgi:hypothetical protein
MYHFVKCPRYGCGAAVGEPCRDEEGKKTSFHRAKWEETKAQLYSKGFQEGKLVLGSPCEGCGDPIDAFFVAALQARELPLRHLLC